jgi:DNA invertase Pin-like site-specific DNA recombinase
MSMLRADDTVVIWRLDRLGRSLKNLIELVERLRLPRSGCAACRKTSTPHRVAAGWSFTCSAHWLSLSEI